jgi:hypothetical protein
MPPGITVTPPTRPPPPGFAILIADGRATQQPIDVTPLSTLASIRHGAVFTACERCRPHQRPSAASSRRHQPPPPPISALPARRSPRLCPIATQTGIIRAQGLSVWNRTIPVGDCQLRRFGCASAISCRPQEAAFSRALELVGMGVEVSRAMSHSRLIAG